MISSIFKISLDVRTTASQATVTVKQGDTARRISVTLSERGKPYLISDECTAVFTAKKPDGNIIFNHCTIEDNVIHYDMTPQTSAAAGLVECEIRLYGGDGALLTGPKFTIVVGKTIYNEGDIVESETEIDALTKLISETGELRADIERKLENGEFVGEQGHDGPQGPAGYTPVKGVDYFDGKDGYTPRKGVDYFDGNDGKDGKDGYTPQKGVDYFDGNDGRTPQKGVDYFDGKDGASVSVQSVSESSEDGGRNIVTFSDGKTVTVKNGKTGSRGPAGESGVVAPVSGFFSLSVDENGDLWVHSAEDGAAPAFEYDSATGALYYVVE